MWRRVFSFVAPSAIRVASPTTRVVVDGRIPSRPHSAGHESPELPNAGGSAGSPALVVFFCFVWARYQPSCLADHRGVPHSRMRAAAASIRLLHRAEDFRGLR